MAPPAPPPSRSRNAGIDVARGLAVILMIETHAYDGWVSVAAKTTSAYLLTRVLSNIPAALFLLLAGVGAALGSARRRAAARPALALRALQIVGYGYLVSLAYAAIEGVFRLEEVLRADILHCIGLSLLVCSYALIGRTRPGLRAALLTATALAAAILAPRVLPPRSAVLPGPLLVPAALLIDVAPYTRFPLLPLCGFCALGVAVGHWLSGGIPGPRRCLAGAGALAVLAALLTWATRATVTALGGQLSRSHPAVVFNLLNGASRALCVLLIALAATGAAPGSAERGLLGALGRLGRGSLLAYAVHIPLCYGRLSAPLSGRLDMGAATIAVAALVLLTYGVVRGRDALRDLRRRAVPTRS